MKNNADDIMSIKMYFIVWNHQFSLNGPKKDESSSFKNFNFSKTLIDNKFTNIVKIIRPFLDYKKRNRPLKLDTKRALKSITLYFSHVLSDFGFLRARNP